MTHLAGIHPDDTNHVWDKVLPMVESAIEYSNGEYTADYLLDCIHSSDAQLWVGHEQGHIRYVCITSVETFKATGATILKILLLAGNGIDDWLDSNLPELESWAIDNGATAIWNYGRSGWERKLRPHGFRKVSTVMAKELTGKH